MLQELDHCYVKKKHGHDTQHHGTTQDYGPAIWPEIYFVGRAKTAYLTDVVFNESCTLQQEVESFLKTVEAFAAQRLTAQVTSNTNLQANQDYTETDSRNVCRHCRAFEHMQQLLNSQTLASTVADLTYSDS